MECPICMEKTNTFKKLGCSHEVCLSCFKIITDKFNSCPFCRQEIKKEEKRSNICCCNDFMLYLSSFL